MRGMNVNMVLARERGWRITAGVLSAGCWSSFQVVEEDSMVVEVACRTTSYGVSDMAKEKGSSLPALPWATSPEQITNVHALSHSFG